MDMPFVSPSGHLGDKQAPEQRGAMGKPGEGGLPAVMVKVKVTGWGEAW